MIQHAVWIAVMGMFFVSCENASETIQVTKTRKLTKRDEPRAQLVPIMPPEWRQVPSTQIRVFNYRFGSEGEVYISQSTGGVLANMNRWLKQYGKPEVASVDDFEKLKVLGREGVLIDVTGSFAGGMGKLPRNNAGLLGFMADFDGNLLTVKMIGDAKEVMAEKERFATFCKTLSKH